MVLVFSSLADKGAMAGSRGVNQIGRSKFKSTIPYVKITGTGSRGIEPTVDAVPLKDIFTIPTVRIHCRENAAKGSVAPKILHRHRVQPCLESGPDRVVQG
jgi:hypothetical protein